MGAAEDLSARDEAAALRRRRHVIVCAAGGVLLLYALGGYYGARLLRRLRGRTARTQQARIVSLTTDPTTHPPTAAPPPRSGPAANPVDIKVALTVTRIGSVALKDSSLTAEFDISFRWRGDAVAPRQRLPRRQGPHRRAREGRGLRTWRGAVRAVSRGGADCEVLRCFALSFSGTRV